MASIQDLYVALNTATQALSKFTATFPRVGGTVIAVNNLSSAGFVPIIGADPNRNNITFVNPGSNYAVVAPTTLGSSGGTFTPSLTQLGGCFLIPPSTAGVPPGPWVTLSGVVQQGWQGGVLAGSSQPLTVMSQ